MHNYTDIDNFTVLENAITIDSQNLWEKPVLSKVDKKRYH